MIHTKQALAAAMSRVLGQQPKPKKERGMNKTESAYALYLAARMQKGEIGGFEFEHTKRKIGENRCWYTPDFLIWTFVPGGVDLEFHEVKGFMRDDARVKLEAAKLHCPWARFILVRRKNGSWIFE